MMLVTRFYGDEQDTTEEYDSLWQAGSVFADGGYSKFICVIDDEEVEFWWWSWWNYEYADDGRVEVTAPLPYTAFAYLGVDGGTQDFYINSKGEYVTIWIEEDDFCIDISTEDVVHRFNISDERAAIDFCNHLLKERA